MTTHSTPFRSVLFMPGSNSRALEKAQSLPTDAVILDLEEAVSPAEKQNAREAVCKAVTDRKFGYRTVIIRINALETVWGPDDLTAACAAQPDAILLPKIGTADDVLAAENRIRGSARIWAMMETPMAALNAASIAASSRRLEAFVLGTNDMLKDLGASEMPERASLATALGLCLLAARAHGLICIDGVYNAFHDTEGLRRECEHGLAMGFDGKSLIHPAQIDVANEVFTPSKSAVARANAEIAAFDAADKRGEAVGVLDGRIVEKLHADIARSVIAKAEAIARQGG